MIRFIASRLFRAGLTVIAVMTFAFVVLRLSGDPAQVLLGPDVPQSVIQAFRDRWGLDDPIWTQYLAYMKAMFQGDFGLSMRDRSPAIDLVLQRIPATLALTIPALILQLAFGIPRGYLCRTEARHACGPGRDRGGDHLRHGLLRADEPRYDIDPACSRGLRIRHQRSQ